MSAHKKGRAKRCAFWRHQWVDAGAMSHVYPVDQCQRCRWFRVMTGFDTYCYPPTALREELPR